jgi:hypothetical protein
MSAAHKVGPPVNSRGHLSSELLDLLMLSALSVAEAAAAKQHLETCTSCQRHWKELNDDKQHFEQFVFARTLPKIEARLVRAPAAWFERLKLWLVLPAAGLVAAAVVALLVFAPRTSTDDQAYVGLKGLQAPSFEIFALRDGGSPFEVRRGAKLLPNDRIRFVVNPGSAKYLLIASRDGAGAFTVYFPFDASQSAKLEPAAGVIELPRAVELDAVVGPEHVVAVFSDAPVTADEVKAALLRDLAAPKVAGATVVTHDFVKTTP